MWVSIKPHPRPGIRGLLTALQCLGLWQRRARRAAPAALPGCALDWPAPAQPATALDA